MDNTIYLIAKIKYLSDKYIAQKLKEIGIEELVSSHGRILVVLFKYKSLTMSDLACKIEKDPSTVTTLVKKLIKLGYVEIIKDEKDKRSNKVVLTQEGINLEDKMNNISKKMYDIQYNDISDEDIIKFREILEKMLENFS